MTKLIDRHSDGVFIIAATPFNDNGSIDFSSTDRMIEFYIECGVSGMTILGMMGEAQKLDGSESVSFARHVLNRVGGRVPIVVGASSGGLDPMRTLTDAAMESGAAGIMVAPMAGLGSEDKVFRYFEQVSTMLGPDVPLCYQDFPQSTGVRVSADTIIRLTSNISQIVMLKHEDWPGLAKLSAVRAGTGTQSVPQISILTGNCALFLPQELERGADGAMTGFAYPEMLVQTVAKYQAGDRDGAEDLFDAFLPLVRYEQQLGIGLAVRKEILKRRGILASAKTRLPGPALSPEDEMDLTRIVARLEKRLKEIGQWIL